MKDIIAAQQIERRTTPSLLSSAAKYRVIPDNSLIADQHLPKRKKNPVLEKIQRLQSNNQPINKQVPPVQQKLFIPKSAPIAPQRQPVTAQLNAHLNTTPPHNRLRDETYIPRQEPRLEQRLEQRQQQRLEHKFDPRIELPQEPLPGDCRKGPTKQDSGRGNSFFSRKKRLLILLLCLAAVCAALFMAVGYIPDPEPPYDTLVRANPDREALSEMHQGDEIPLDLTETFAWQSYTVRNGDTVEAIAKRFGLSIDAIIASNEVSNVRMLKAGERIRIPNMDGIPYTVKRGDSYAKIAAKQDVPLTAILDANDIQSDDIRVGSVLFIPGAKMDKTDLRRALGTLFIWPLSGKLTSGYGWRNDPFTGVRSFHGALDIKANTGTSVKAMTDGRVSSTGYNSVYGNFLIISHPNDYQTMYAHLSRILVKQGAYVSQGSVIARSGNSGRSTGPHLHFAVYKNKRAINPLDILNK